MSRINRTIENKYIFRKLQVGRNKSFFLARKGNTGKPRLAPQAPLSLPLPSFSVRPSVVIGGSRECSHHFLSIHISAPRLRPQFPNPAPPRFNSARRLLSANTPAFSWARLPPLCGASVEWPEESFSATRLPPLCRAGVEWRSIRTWIVLSFCW